MRTSANWPAISEASNMEWNPSISAPISLSTSMRRCLSDFFTVYFRQASLHCSASGRLIKLNSLRSNLKSSNHLPPECHKMQSEISPHCQPLSIQKSSAGADETVDNFEWLDLGSRSPQSMASSELPWALAHSYRGQDTATMQTCLTNPWNQTALLTLYSKTSSLARVLLESLGIHGKTFTSLSLTSLDLSLGHWPLSSRQWRDCTCSLRCTWQKVNHGLGQQHLLSKYLHHQWILAHRNSSWTSSWTTTSVQKTRRHCKRNSTGWCALWCWWAYWLACRLACLPGTRG